MIAHCEGFFRYFFVRRRRTRQSLPRANRLSRRVGTMRMFRTPHRSVCLFLIFIAARAPRARADHDEAPIFGLFDFSSFFAGVSSDAKQQSFPNLPTNFTVHEPDFAGFIQAARALAHGEAGDLTTSFIEAAVNGVEYGSFLQGSDGAELEPEFPPPLIDHHHPEGDFERVRRETFQNIFESVLNVTAATMVSTIDEEAESGERLRSNVERAVDDARRFASAFADASTETERREAALELYDRVSSTLGRTRDALRHAMATSSNGVAEANALFSGDVDGPFTESNSHWVVTSTTTRDDDAFVTESALAVESAHESRSSDRRIVAVALGCALTLAGVGVFFCGRHRDASRRRSTVARVHHSHHASKPSRDDRGVFESDLKYVV